MSMAERRRMLLATLGGFPSQEPTAYELIGTYTTSQTWMAPESGYFQIEVFGASGNGGAAIIYNSMPYGGGGGGGGGYACSRVKLRKGDILVFSPATVGATSSVTFNSSIETYDDLQVTSGANGKNATGSATIYGGAGGVANGGNYANNNGGAGANGRSYKKVTDGWTGYGGTGGTSGYTGGNDGGKGANGYRDYSEYDHSWVGSPGYGKAGFIKIYRGNTN